MEERQIASGEQTDSEAGQLLNGCEELIDRLYEEAGAKRWGLPRESFAAALVRSARKRFPDSQPRLSELEEYLGSLHLEDLALACACGEGLAAAWEEFVAGYRSYLRASAAAILRCSAAAPEACELADSLFAELYGLADGKRAERSLFRYFHGRSSLKTWLRAVLAQRRVDAVRAAKKFDSLDVPDGETKLRRPDGAGMQHPPDPHQAEYLRLCHQALEAALDTLPSRDLACLRLYYAEEKTLAQIGLLRGEHESSVSRNLERIRRAIRVQVEETLRRGGIRPDGLAGQKGLSEEQIALCFEYAAADAPIDLNQLLKERGHAGIPLQRREA
jgi:RNA polymerase sigma-70 factor, ECF subfamily